MASVLGTYYINALQPTITQADNISYLSVGCLSGTVTVLCEAKKITSWGANSAIPLSTGQSVNVHETINIQTLDGITIDASGGTAGVVIG